MPNTTNFTSLTLSLPAHWIVPVVRVADFTPLLQYEPLIAMPDDHLFDGAWDDLFGGATPLRGGVLACDCYDVEILVEE